MRLTVRRFRLIDGGVLGKLTIGNYSFYTVEKPWRANRPFSSCVPEGIYAVQPHYSPKFKECYIFWGGTVGRAESDLNEGIKRYKCLIHVANWPSQVQGCIGVGKNIFEDGSGVASSRQALSEIRGILIESNQLVFELDIGWE